jgi:hypothetical protein
MYREIPSLSVTCLKFISKTPTVCITEDLYANIIRRYSTPLIDTVTQLLINSITESGRMADDIIPLISFEQTKSNTLSLKNSKITGVYLSEIIQRCGPQLISIDVSGCLMVDDVMVEKLLQTCLQLQRLEIRNCRKLTDESLESLIRGAPHLIHINLGGNFNMTENGIIRFVEKHPNRQKLLSLNISGLPISEQTLHSLTANCLSLKSLGIGYALITEAMVRNFLEKNGNRLESLCISWLTPPYSTTGVSGDIIDFISKTCPRLQTLDISGLQNITSSAIGNFVDSKRTRVSSIPCLLSSCFSLTMLP